VLWIWKPICRRRKVLQKEMGLKIRFLIFVTDGVRSVKFYTFGLGTRFRAKYTQNPQLSYENAIQQAIRFGEVTYECRAALFQVVHQ
jgi:hypothetical protein